MFELHANLKNKDFICNLGLCTVLFEDNKDYPWVFLVPQRKDVHCFGDLTLDERLELTSEVNIVEQVMLHLFHPDQTNVATIGNKTPQMHIHIICRYKKDPLWPETVWGAPSKPYASNEKKIIIERIKKEIEKCQE